MTGTDLTVKVGLRSELGKGASRRLRREGKVPAIVYGHGQEATSLSMDQADVMNSIHHSGMVGINVEGGKSFKTILKDYQLDHMTGAIMHVDFQEVREDEEIYASVPIESEGDPVGTSKGGVLEQCLGELEINCLPKNLQETFKVDVSGMEVGDTLLISDLSFEGIKILNDEDQQVFHVGLPKAPTEDEDEEEEVTEVEVIGEKKE